MSASYLAQNYSFIKSNFENKMIKYTILIILSLFIISICCIGSSSAATITFNGNADGAPSPSPITADNGEYITLPTPVWSGHTFAYWTTYSFNGGDKYAGGSRYQVSKSLTLYAQWVPKYTIKFDGNADGAPSPSPMTADNGEYIPLPTPVWSGHTFAYWTTYSFNGGDKYPGGSRYQVSKSLTLYAQWVPKYTIKFDGNADGAPSPSPITVDNGEYITLPTPVWSGHTFDCWTQYSYGTGNKYEGGSRYKVSGSTTLYAKWVKKYTIIFNSNAEGVDSFELSADNGDYITIPSSTRENYTFKYWTTTSSDSGTRYYVGNSYKVSGSTKFYAQWEKNKITVSFDANGGSSISPKTITLDTSFVLPGTSWFGNEFTGWYLNDVYIGKEGDTYKPTESVTLIARWNKGGIGTYLMYGGIIVIGIIILIIIVAILRRHKAKRQLQYQNNNSSDNNVINTEQRAKEIAELEKEAIINEANRKLAVERKTAEERQKEIDSIKYESEQKIAAEKKTTEDKQREIDLLKKQEPKQIIYHVHGDLHSENIGILAKDDAIVNHGKVSTSDNKDNSPKLFDEEEVNVRKCTNCGAEITNKDDLFCNKCGKKLGEL